MVANQASTSAQPHSRWCQPTRLTVHSLLIQCVCLVTLTFCGNESADASGAAQSDREQEARIDRLVEQLGAEQYAVREVAQEELLRLGVAAFESLHRAQSHPDVEVRKQAEYLLRAIRIAWVQEEDPAEVKRILRNYRQEERERRMQRLEELGRVPNGAGLEALCRLARFEADDVLARRAALTVMQYPWQETSMTRDQVQHVITRVVATSERTPSTWLRTYVDYLETPTQMRARWEALTAQEEMRVAERPDKDRLDVLADFIRWQMEAMQQAGDEEAMVVLMGKYLPMHASSREDVVATMEWIIERRAWNLIPVVQSQHPRWFASDPQLMYRRAESLRLQGDDEQAESLAQKALNWAAPNAQEGGENGTDEASDAPFRHVQLGVDLKDRGLPDWAEREFRYEMEHAEPGEYTAIEAAFQLGFMFHDLGRNREAYEAFKRLVDLMENDPLNVRRAQEIGRVPNQIRSQMYFSLALAHRDEENWDEHRQTLEKALQYDQDNADILIAMYRVPNPEDTWTAVTTQRIERLRDKYRQRVISAERDFQTLPGELTSAQLAQQLNQYAWLVSNTFGDFEGALKASQRSLELSSDNAGYLDTLARCYFANRQLEDAVRTQTRAVELEPHSGQIGRQLEYFQEQLAQQSSPSNSSSQKDG